MGEEQGELKSIFNTGLKLMDRIDLELTFVSKDSHALRFPEWANDLFVIGREVRHLMNTEQKPMYDQYFIGLTSLITRNYTLEKNGTYNLKKSYSSEEYNNLYVLLIEFDTFIREVLQDKDLLFANKANARTAVTN